MLVKIGRRQVDVLDRKCGSRECFSLGFDKGTYSPGRGYTSYHTDGRGRRVERAVCGTRHYGGCPTNSVCQVCRSASVEPPGSKCDRKDCDGERVA